jgi:hypothetical protein
MLVAMLYTKIVAKAAFVSRISAAFPLGLGTGLVLHRHDPGRTFPQLGTRRSR